MTPLREAIYALMEELPAQDAHDFCGYLEQVLLNHEDDPTIDDLIRENTRIRALLVRTSLALSAAEEGIKFKRQKDAIAASLSSEALYRETHEVGPFAAGRAEGLRRAVRMLDMPPVDVDEMYFGRLSRWGVV